MSNFNRFDKMGIRESQLEYTIFIIISIFLLAEIVRYGAQLKEDQDLTV